MSERILKLLDEEEALTTATTFGGNKLFRIKNSHSTNSVAILVKDGSTTTGSISLYAGEVMYIQKKSTETIESSAADTTIKIVPVAFGD